MPTSISDLWDAILKTVPRDEWVEISSIYSLVEAETELQPSDHEPSALDNADPTWRRNVRNALQSHKHSDILWGHRGLYYFPTELADRAALLNAERLLRRNWWQELIDKGGPNEVRPDLLRQIGLYKASQGMWVDKDPTAHLSEDGNGVTVALLHTGRHYPDELDQDALIYHYPDTTRPGNRDSNETAATKNTRIDQPPIFVVTHPTPSSQARNVHLAWVEDWNDETAEFLVTFSEMPPPSRTSNSQREETPFHLTSPHRSSTASHTVRPGQAKFRFDVFQRYGPACAVCDIKILDLLEAAHIRPYENSGSDDARNGIVLCANHHKAFDAGLFRIHPGTYRISPSQDLGNLDIIGIAVERLDPTRPTPHPDAIAWRWQSHPDHKGA